MSPASKDIKNSIEEIDKAKLESVMQKTIDGDKRYLESLNQRYNDIFE